MVTIPVTGLFQTTVFWFKEFIDHRDPHLLGPPLRPDPQSYSALSDYLLTYSYSIPGGNFQPLSMCSSCAGGGSALPLSTTRCPSSIFRKGQLLVNARVH